MTPNSPTLAPAAATTLAVVTAETRWDYHTLAQQVTARALLLRQQGLRPHQVVLVPADGADTVVMLHALAALDAAVLPIATTASSTALHHYIQSSAAEWCWQPATQQLQPTGVIGPATALMTSWCTDPLTVMVSTSGSSGAPKLALFRRSAVLIASAAANARLQLHTGDRWLCCLPLQHVGGLAISYRCAHAGATLVLLPRFAADTVTAWLHAAQITHMSLVPLMLARLLEYAPRPPRDLRVVLVGGQALEPALAQAALSAGWPLYISYGMTETFALLASRPLSTGEAATCVGLPLPPVTCHCGSCSDHPVAQPLQVRGPTVMAGYATPTRQPGVGLNAAGWLTTADVACQTPDGQLYVHGRADDCLIIAGVNVLPQAIEQRLLKVPGVIHCVVLGVPAPQWGAQLIAFYSGTIAPAELVQWSRDQLNTEQRPRRFIHLAQLPLLPSGKWDRQALMQQLLASI